jgi:hypothetical protein
MILDKMTETPNKRRNRKRDVLCRRITCTYKKRLKQENGPT